MNPTTIDLCLFMFRPLYHFSGVFPPYLSPFHNRTASIFCLSPSNMQASVPGLNTIPPLECIDLWATTFYAFMLLRNPSWFCSLRSSLLQNCAKFIDHGSTHRLQDLKRRGSPRQNTKYGYFWLTGCSACIDLECVRIFPKLT